MLYYIRFTCFLVSDHSNRIVKTRNVKFVKDFEHSRSDFPQKVEFEEVKNQTISPTLKQLLQEQIFRGEKIHNEQKIQAAVEIFDKY